jgi:hypothetical protein
LSVSEGGEDAIPGDMRTLLLQVAQLIDDRIDSLEARQRDLLEEEWERLEHVELDRVRARLSELHRLRPRVLCSRMPDREAPGQGGACPEAG